MATNWINPYASDLIKVISTQLRRNSDENIPDDPSVNQPTQSSGSFDPSVDSRGDEIITLIVNQFRGAIQKAGKYPLSITEGSIPPDLMKHFLNMAAFELVNSSQTLQMVVLTEKGAYSPFQTFYKAAEEELEKIRKGYAIVLPTDPTGQDYINPVNIPWCAPWCCEGVSPYPPYDPTKPINPPISGVKVGAISPPADLQTEQSIFNEVPYFFPVCTLGQP